MKKKDHRFIIEIGYIIIILQAREREGEREITFNIHIKNDIQNL